MVATGGAAKLRSPPLDRAVEESGRDDTKGAMLDLRIRGISTPHAVVPYI